MSAYDDEEEEESKYPTCSDRQLGVKPGREHWLVVAEFYLDHIRDRVNAEVFEHNLKYHIGTDNVDTVKTPGNKVFILQHPDAPTDTADSANSYMEDVGDLDENATWEAIREACEEHWAEMPVLDRLEILKRTRGNEGVDEDDYDTSDAEALTNEPPGAAVHVIEEDISEAL